MFCRVTMVLLTASILSGLPAVPAFATTGPGCYRVVGVPAWDVLNVRAWGSARAPIVLALSSQTYGIISGRGACRKGWCPVAVSDEHGTKRGWIRRKFLAPSDCP